MDFASDNASGASPEVMHALMVANSGFASAYGADPWSLEAQARLSALRGAGQREAKDLARTLDLVAVMLDVSGELNCCCCCCCCRLPTATVRASDSQMWL